MSTNAIDPEVEAKKFRKKVADRIRLLSSPFEGERAGERVQRAAYAGRDRPAETGKHGPRPCSTVSSPEPPVRPLCVAGVDVV